MKSTYEGLHLLQKPIIKAHKVQSASAAIIKPMSSTDLIVSAAYPPPMS